MPYIHIEKWAKRAAQDYYMLFVRAWIPFNAWFKRECYLGGITNLSDSNCISHICNNPNTFKTKILSLLDGNDKSSEEFKANLGALQNALMHHIIPEPATPLNFSTMIPDITSTNLIDQDFRTLHYRVERIIVGNSFQYEIHVEEKNTHATKYHKHINGWKIADIQSDPSFISLTSEECKKKIVEYFKEVNPQKPLDIVLQPRILADGSKQKPQHSIEMGKDSGVYFINDTDKIAKVLIRLLYKLRCEIFHGSLDPTEANMEIYEYAYKIQYELVKELV